MSALYPAMLKLEGQRCVVVGGGQVAARKIGRLLQAGASVTVIAPAVEPEVQALADRGLLRAERRIYRRGDLEGAMLAFAATDSRTVNAAVADEAGALGVPVNVADNPTLSTFQVPAAIERHGITVAISTGGRSPAFARRLREDVEALLTEEKVALLELYAELRASLAERGQSVAGAAWGAADGRALQLLREGRRAEARQVLRQQVLSAAGRERE